MNRQMTERVKDFLSEIAVVCREHGLQLATSRYDYIEVWNLDPGEPEIYCAGVEDMTGELPEC